MAFLKRLGICALQSSAPIAAGLLFLMSEIYRVRPNLLTMMTANETLVPHKTYNNVNQKKQKKGDDSDDDNEDGGDGDASHQLGNFEGSKREPAFAVTSTPALWEASLLRNHFHPSVKSFSASMLEDPHQIIFAGDPTTEFSLNAFLNRFAYKNPKKQHSDKIRRPQAMEEEPLNTTSFLKSDPMHIAPDKIFFHKFFGEKEKLRVEGKSRDRSKRKEHDDDGGDNDSMGSDDDDEVDFDEKAIDKYATKLAEDMMRDNDDGIDIDDDYSDSDDNSGDDSNDDNDDDDEDFDMGGSDIEEESSAFDFDEYKEQRSKKNVEGSKDGKKDGKNIKLKSGSKSKIVEVESDDDYELTPFGGSDDELVKNDDEDDNDEDDSENDSDGDINTFSDMDDDDDEDEDDLSMAFSDDVSGKGKMSQKSVVDNKKGKGKGKKPAGDMSDFASAEDYEDTMEEIVGRYSGNVENKAAIETKTLIDSLKRKNDKDISNTKKIVPKSKKFKKN